MRKTVVVLESFDDLEIELAAPMYISVGENRAAAEWGIEVVVLSDNPPQFAVRTINLFEDGKWFICEDENALLEVFLHVKDEFDLHQEIAAGA